MKAKFSVVITREKRHVALGNMPIQRTEGVRVAFYLLLSHVLHCTVLVKLDHWIMCLKRTCGQGSTNTSNQDRVSSQTTWQSTL